ncbi:putative membrane protein [Luteimonas cucumeris]|uniref:Putative membrane protein n=1 Tax=Luteimonas cucumeris TaxID=985012 RepID=A0A562LEE6_9GAMM|nr:TMEM175 family protein [Luteimonas cucumeris]TWI06052.1 putative membrane protein [Luteimonas cucumeris]
MQTGETPIPGKDGFRRRGVEVTRLEAFVDAAFAFAVTLLVISVDSIPDSLDALALALKGVPAFAASFVMIAMFWNAHANWSRRFGLDDGASKVLSLALVFLVLVYVYPLRIQFGVLFGWISGGRLPFPVRIDGVADLGFMFLVYGVAFATMSLCLFGLYVHAWRCRGAIGLDGAEAAATAGEAAAYACFVIVGLLSIALSVWIRDTQSPAVASLPGMAYFLLGFTGMVAAHVQRRVQARSATA